MLVAERISKRFAQQQVLHQVSLHIRPGEFVGIVGPNGCGKSTLLRILSGVLTADEGLVRLNGRELGRYGRKELARLLAVVSQEGLPPVSFSVQEVLLMGRFSWQGHFQGRSARDMEVVERVMGQTGLTPLRHKLLHQLSGGERQRVAIAQAMVQEPVVLLLDEPTTYLDIGYQVAIMELITAWHRECGLTVVTVMHDLNLAARYCQRLVWMQQGQIVASGTPEEMLSREMVQEIYGLSPVVVKHPRWGVPQILLN